MTDSKRPQACLPGPRGRWTCCALHTPGLLRPTAATCFFKNGPVYIPGSQPKGVDRPPRPAHRQAQLTHVPALFREGAGRCQGQPVQAAQLLRLFIVLLLYCRQAQETVGPPGIVCRLLCYITYLQKRSSELNQLS